MILLQTTLLVSEVVLDAARLELALDITRLLVFFFSRASLSEFDGVFRRDRGNRR